MSTQTQQRWRAGGHMARALLGALLALGFAPSPARAHGGPPFLVVPGERLGPYDVTAWADPDIGNGTFIIQMTTGGAPPPPRTTVSVAAAPRDRRRAELLAIAERQQQLFGGEQFLAQLPFDAGGAWDVTLRLDGPAGVGEARFSVQVTPPGIDWWATLLCLAPFAALGGLWIWGLRRMQREAAPQQAPVSKVDNHG